MKPSGPGDFLFGELYLNFKFSFFNGYKTLEMTFCIRWVVIACCWGVDGFHLTCHIYVYRIHHFPILSSWCLQAWTDHPFLFLTVVICVFSFSLSVLLRALLKLLIILKSQLFPVFNYIDFSSLLLASLSRAYVCCCSRLLRLETLVIDFKNFPLSSCKHLVLYILFSALL